MRFYVLNWQGLLLFLVLFTFLIDLVDSSTDESRHAVFSQVALAVVELVIVVVVWQGHCVSPWASFSFGSLGMLLVRRRLVLLF